MGSGGHPSRYGNELEKYWSQKMSSPAHLEVHGQRRAAPGLALPHRGNQLHRGGQRVLRLARKLRRKSGEQVAE